MSKKFISLMLAVIILMSSTAAFAKPKTIYVNPKGTYDHMLYKGMRDDTDEVEFPDGELDIAYMQVRLKYYGYYSGSIDGIFGTNTRNAILNFQRRNNLNVDGKIGANTWYALAADDSVHTCSAGSVFSTTITAASPANMIPPPPPPSRASSSLSA